MAGIEKGFINALINALKDSFGLLLIGPSAGIMAILLCTRQVSVPDNFDKLLEYSIANIAINSISILMLGLLVTCSDSRYVLKGFLLLLFLANTIVIKIGLISIQVKGETNQFNQIIFALLSNR